MEKTLILIRGVSGAGKSTLAEMFEGLNFATVAVLVSIVLPMFTGGAVLTPRP